MVVLAQHSKSKWILDSRCSFLLTPNKDWLHYSKNEDGGMVLLGDNKDCKVIREGLITF